MYDENKDEVVQLYLDDIIPNRFQPREVFDEKALKELAVSIKEHGVIQPIIVRNINGKYEIIAGERRYKASALAGMTKIPAIIRNLDDKESSKVALLENLQRRNLNPIEEARTYQNILELDQMTQEELARTMGKSQSAVANKLRLLSLPEEIQESLLKEQISERHARALLNVPDVAVQKEMVERIITTKMSVRALEEEIKEKYPKGKDASDIPIDQNASASIGGLLDSTPLIPTSSTIEEETSNYGKVVIAPPTNPDDEDPEGEEKTMDKFINYGENNKEQNIGMGMNGAGLLDVIPSINVNEVRQNATDIKAASSGAAIDNLLNIPTSTPPTMSKEEKAEKEDYFSSPELASIKIENTSLPEQNNLSPSILPSIDSTPIGLGESTTGNYTIEEATKKIKQTIEDLKNHGVSINADEMNFPKSYQIIIKIDKE